MRDPAEIHKLLYDGVWVPGSTLPSPLWRATGPLFGISYGRTTRPSGLEEACGSWMPGSERVSHREPLAGSSGAPDGHRAGFLSGDEDRPRALVPKAPSGWPDEISSCRHARGSFSDRELRLRMFVGSPGVPAGCTRGPCGVLPGVTTGGASSDHHNAPNPSGQAHRLAVAKRSV